MISCAEALNKVGIIREPPTSKWPDSNIFRRMKLRAFQEACVGEDVIANAMYGGRRRRRWRRRMGCWGRRLEC